MNRIRAGPLAGIRGGGRRGDQTSDAGATAYRGLLPGSTINAETHRWRLCGTDLRPRSVFRWRQKPEVAVIRIKMFDRRGGDFRELDELEDVEIERLIAADGFVYLFDTTQEHDRSKLDLEFFNDQARQTRVRPVWPAPETSNARRRVGTACGNPCVNCVESPSKCLLCGVTDRDPLPASTGPAALTFYFSAATSVVPVIGPTSGNCVRSSQ